MNERKLRRKADAEMDERVLVLRGLHEKPSMTQRELSEYCGISLGKVNHLLSSCEEQGYLLRERGEGRGRNVSFRLERAALDFLKPYKVDAALILAAGFGSRFVPLSYELPKGLWEVFGERMIERQIRQLREAGIGDITILVGYLKEKFDYLIDRYGVKLLYNPEYAEKNTLATLYHARELLRGKNCYILSSDNWIRENLYHEYEPASWYAASFMEGETEEWVLHFGKDRRIREAEVGGRDAFCMYGPVFLSKDFSADFLPLLESYYRMPGTEQFYWEDVLIRNLKSLPPIYANPQRENIIYEFENLEELRSFDERYIHSSGSRAMRITAEVLGVPESDIVDIRCLKAGMTNKSWLFSVRESSETEKYRGKSFICRIPGPGTEKLIDRRAEGRTYEKIRALHITEELLHFDPENGYKISVYYRGARNADFSKEEERRACMRKLRELHASGIRLDHDFDIGERLKSYESLCLSSGGDIPFEDYPKIRRESFLLLRFLEEQKREKTICHIDSVCDNFLFTEEGLKMIDWEYAGMADPMIDIAMAAIYSYMDFEEARNLLREYLRAEPEGAKSSPDQPDRDEELYPLVAAYMGLGGLLWALWCCYKISLGEKFGDYSLKMYRYFKDSLRILQNLGKF